MPHPADNALNARRVACFGFDKRRHTSLPGSFTGPLPPIMHDQPNQQRINSRRHVIHHDAQTAVQLFPVAVPATASQYQTNETARKPAVHAEISTGHAASAIHCPATSSITTCPGSSAPLSRSTIEPAGIPINTAIRAATAVPTANPTAAQMRRPRREKPHHRRAQRSPCPGPRPDEPDPAKGPDCPRPPRLSPGVR